MSVRDSDSNSRGLCKGPCPSLRSRPGPLLSGARRNLAVADHSEPVTVRPGEVGLVSLGEEVIDSLKIAVPILGGWLVVISFLLSYGEATRG